MSWPPTFQGARTDASTADDPAGSGGQHAADHSTLDQADKDTVTELTRHEAASTTEHNLAALLAAKQAHSTALDAVTGTNTGDQDLSSYATSAAVAAGYQPLDSDLTAIAALATTAFGRSVLAQADAAALRALAGLGTAATHATTDYDAAGAAAAAQAASQPLDSDLTAIAALTTTTFGRSLLAMADAATVKTALALVEGDVGLGNVDNTSDANKPVSTAQQAALDLKAPLASPTFTGTVAGISKSMVGLGNVDNTSDATKLASPTVTGHPTVEGVTSTGATGTGKFVFDGSPTLVTPNLGTPSAVNLANGTGLPAAGVTGTALVAAAIGTTVQAFDTGLTAIKVAYGGVTYNRRALDWFLGAPHAIDTTITANVDNSTDPVTITIANQNSFRAGQHRKFQIGTERFHSTSGEGTTSITAKRAVDGTTIAAHTSGDAVIFSRVAIAWVGGDSVPQGTVVGAGITGSYESATDILRNEIGKRFGGSLGRGYVPLWRCGNDLGASNTGHEWHLTGSWTASLTTNTYDLAPYQSFAATSSTAITSVTTTDAGDTFGKTSLSASLSNGDLVFLSSIVSTTGIATATSYYVVNMTAGSPDTCQLSLTPGGAAVAIATNGTCTITRQAMAVLTKQPGETWAQIDVNGVDYTSAATGDWSYSVDGGVTWVANPNVWTTHTNPPTVKVSSIAVANTVTEFRIRAANAANVASFTVFFGATRWSTVPTWGVTRGWLVNNSGYDGNTLAAFLRSRTFDDFAITSTTTLTSNTATFVAGDSGKTFTAPGVPAGTTLTFVSATQCTLSTASTNATGLIGTIQGSSGDWSRMFGGDPGSMPPDLFIWLSTNDMSAASIGARTVTGSITAGVLTVTSGTLYAGDTGKVIGGTGITAGSTITFTDSTHAAVTGTTTAGSTTVTIGGLEATINAAWNSNLATLDAKLGPMGSVLYVNPYEQGVTRLDGTQSTSAKQATFRATTKAHNLGNTITGTITSTTTLTVTSGTLTTADHGRRVSGPGIALNTLLTYVSPTSATLSQACTNAVGVVLQIGARALLVDMYDKWVGEGNTGYAACAADGLIDTTDTSGFHLGPAGHRSLAAGIIQPLVSL